MKLLTSALLLLFSLTILFSFISPASADWCIHPSCSGTSGRVNGADWNAARLNAQRIDNQAATAFSAADATPDVSGQIYIYKTADTTIFTDFDDGTDHTGITDGRTFKILFQHAAGLDCTASQINCNNGQDWTASDGDVAECTFDDTTDADGQWLCNVTSVTIVAADITDQNAGTDITADLEEEGAINATAVTGNPAGASAVLFSTGANAAGWDTTPAIDCTDCTNLIAADSVGTAELNDGSDAPAVNEIVRVDSAATGQVEYGPCTQSDTGVIDCPAPATDGGAMTLKEGQDDGVNTFSISIPSTGLTSTIDHEVSATGQFPAAVVAADHIDAITEIAAALKSGADGTLMTGTAGVSGNCAQFNIDGDVVDSGAACGGGSGDNVTIDGVAAIDPDLRSEGDIDTIRCTAAATPDASCVAAEDVIFRVNTNSVALTTDTTGNYAAGDAEAGNALTGDSATSFFAAGTIEHERGGLEADVSGYGDGLFGTNGTSTIDVDTEAELETALGGIDVLTTTDTVIKSIYWGAGAISTDGTDCSDPSEVTINSGPKQFTIACPMASSETNGILYGSVVMPDSWEGGTFTLELITYMTTDAGSGTMHTEAFALCRTDDETIDATWGTSIDIDIVTVAGDAVNEILTATSGAITGNGCAAGEMLFWKIEICDTDATPDGNCTSSAGLEDDFSILGVKMEYTIDYGGD